jgi:transposase
MLGTADPQGSLLGVDSLLSRLFEGDESSFYARLARHGEELIGDEDFAGCYSSGQGRPSIPPSLLMKAVLLQIRDDVSDREAARRAAKDLDWKRALRLEPDDVPFHHTTLSVFRSRLLVNDADGAVLAATVRRAVEHGLFAKKVLAIADSTGVMGAAAVMDTYELIRQATVKLIEAAGGPKGLPTTLRRDARQVVRGKARIDWADPAARRAELGRLVVLGRALLTFTESDESVVEARELLSRILDQDVDDGDDGQPRIRQGVARDRVVSVVDPEMRHGRKSPSHRIDGYKAHVVTDHDTELILEVTATPANDPDGPQLADMVANAKAAGVPIGEVLGDTAYGDGDPLERSPKGHFVGSLLVHST